MNKYDPGSDGSDWMLAAGLEQSLGGPADPDLSLLVAGLRNVQEVPGERLGWTSRRGGTWEAQCSGC